MKTVIHEDKNELGESKIKRYDDGSFNAWVDNCLLVFNPNNRFGNKSKKVYIDSVLVFNWSSGSDFVFNSLTVSTEKVLAVFDSFKQDEN